MNERKTFYRKLVYGGAMAALLFPLSLLSSPRTVDDPGGKLAQLKTANGLSQADLGEVDPASETMKLATLGLRGVAVNLLWHKANEYKKTEDWSNLTATLEQLSKLQPNFVTFWKFQSWNLSYNVSVEFDDYKDRYYYVRRGIEFLEKGQNYNRDNPQLLWELGWFLGQKIGRSDEKVQYRRLFKADDDYHPSDRPQAERDNWLVSKLWYDESVNAADDKGKGIGRKSPVVFYSSSSKSQMNYSEAIEGEGLFDRAVRGWKIAENDWVDFGNRELMHSRGVKIRLGTVEAVTEQIEQKWKDLEALSPGASEKAMEEVRNSLTEAQREALDTEPGDRTNEQANLAYEAKSKVELSPRQLAEQVSKANPDKSRLALQLATEIDTLKTKKRYTENYKSTGNYDYWLVRTQFEQTADAVEARELLFRGKNAYTKQLDPIAAKELYEQAFVKWKKVFEAFPVLLDEDGTTGDDVLVYVIEYDKILETLDEEFPDDFPLWDLIENFDLERKLEDDLNAYKQRMAEKGSSGDDSATEESATESDEIEEESAEETAPAEPDSEPETAAESDTSESVTSESDTSDSASSEPITSEQ